MTSIELIKKLTTQERAFPGCRFHIISATIPGNDGGDVISAIQIICDYPDKTDWKMNIANGVFVIEDGANVSSKLNKMLNR